MYNAPSTASSSIIDTNAAAVAYPKGEHRLDFAFNSPNIINI